MGRKTKQLQPVRPKLFGINNPLRANVAISFTLDGNVSDIHTSNNPHESGDQLAIRLQKGCACHKYFPAFFDGQRVKFLICPGGIYCSDAKCKSTDINEMD